MDVKKEEIMITIDEAIKRQEEIIRTGTLGNTITAYKAMLLSIEALKTLQKYRKSHRDARYALLPGETKD